MAETTTIKFWTIDEAENAPDLQPIWGNWFFRDCAVFEVGEPGIAKTTVNFGFCKAIVDNKPFLGVKSTVKDPVVLYMEFEASKSLIKLRMRAMGGYPTNSNRFIVYTRDEEFHTIAQIEEALFTLGVKPDIIFVDPIRLAFVMRDENDNAEATKHMKVVKGIARKYNCCIVLVHHSSKAELTGTRKGSGAYTWSALSDVNMNLDRLYDGDGKEIDRDLFALTIPKNRMIDDDFCVCVRKVHESRGFEVVNFPIGAKFSVDGQGTALERYTIQRMITEEILGMAKMRFGNIREAVKTLKKRDITDIAVHKAINNLIASGLIEYEGEESHRVYFKKKKV